MMFGAKKTSDNFIAGPPTVAHPIASIALQSFKIRKVMVAIMLYVLKTMTWYLKTAFGQSKFSFCGTAPYPSMGLDQGNGVAPSEKQNEMIIMGHQISSCHVPVVRSFFIL
jgi:hypothetical protein